MAASDASPFPIKNQAFRVTFPILDADGDLVTGAAGLDSEVSKDGGTFADCTNEATEIATSSGMYYLDLSATEMNADTVAIIVKTSTSGAKTTPIVLYPVTLTEAMLGVNVEQWNNTSVPTENTAGYPIVTVKDGTGTGEIDTASGRVAITEAQIDQIVDEVWDEDVDSTHQTAGTAGKKLDDAGGAADPWATALPGAYGAGTAGKIVGDNLNATISSRASQTSLDTVDDFLDTEVAAIKAKTDNLPSDPADASDIASSFSTVNTKLNTIDDFLDTEIAAIKTVTDKLDSAQAEPTGAPAANETPLEKIGYLFMVLRNKLTVSASAKTFYDDSGAAEWSKALSDDGTTYTEAEGA